MKCDLILLVLLFNMIQSIVGIVDNCIDNCTNSFLKYLDKKAACHRFMSSPPMPLPYEYCEQGFSVGIDIGCLHRCNSPRSKWNIHAESIVKARLAACKNELEYAPPACGYGFHLAILKIFEYSFQFGMSDDIDRNRTLLLNEALERDTVSEAYISYPIETLTKSVVYIYMEENDDPETLASSYCAKQGYMREEEIECIVRIKAGLEERVKKQEWKNVFPRVMLFLPIEIQGVKSQLVAFYGDSVERTALRFCKQTLGNSQLLQTKQCLQGVMDKLEPEVARLH